MVEDAAEEERFRRLRHAIALRYRYSGIAPAIIESCQTRLLLPNERAIEPQISAIYRRFGLNDRQIEILARATPKRDYYCQSRRGNRLFELGLGEVALAFCAASSKTDQAAMRACSRNMAATVFWPPGYACAIQAGPPISSPIFATWRPRHDQALSSDGGKRHCALTCGRCSGTLHARVGAVNRVRPRQLRAECRDRGT